MERRLYRMRRTRIEEFFVAAESEEAALSFRQHWSFSQEARMNGYVINIEDRDELEILGSSELPAVHPDDAPPESAPSPRQRKAKP